MLFFLAISYDFMKVPEISSNKKIMRTELIQVIEEVYQMMEMKKIYLIKKQFPVIEGVH